MEIKEIKASILNYIEEEDSFALFLDGEWGIGKTHFINNEIIFKESPDSYDTAYISLYEKTSLKDIKESIFAELLGNLKTNKQFKNKIKKFISNSIFITDIPYLNNKNISSTMISQLNKTQIEDLGIGLNNSSKTVCIIDDIERISNNINFEEVLGFIRNTLLDKFNCKVILIGNQKKMNECQKCIFDNHYEKVIRRTLYMSSNMKFAIDKVGNLLESNSENYEEDFKKLFEERIGYNENEEDKNVTKIVPLNLRTFLSAISDYKYILSQLDNPNKEEKLSLFITLFILNNERYRLNNIKNDIKNIQLSIFDNKKETKNNLYENYANRNTTVQKYTYFSEDLINFVLKGVINIENYQKNLKDNLLLKDKKTDIMAIFMNRFSYSQIKIEDAQREAEDIINKKRMSYLYRLNLYCFLNVLHSEALLIDNIDLNILEKKIIDDFELQKSETIEGKKVLELSSFSFPENIKDKMNELKRDLNKQQENLMKENSVYLNYLKNILNANRAEGLNYLRSYKEFENKNIVMLLNNYFEELKTYLKSNKCLQNLNKEILYGSSILVEDKEKDKFKSNIEMLKSETQDKLSIINYDNIIKNVTKIGF